MGETGDAVPDKKVRTFDSLKAAATGMKLPVRVLKRAKAAGCPAFRSNRVYEGELLEWLDTHREAYDTATDDPRDEKLREEIRKLRIANDAKEGRLVERAWVAERMQRAAGDLNNMRAKWEAEMPVKFAETNGDIAECRTVLRGIFDQVLDGIQSLSKHFEEGTK